MTRTTSTGGTEHGQLDPATLDDLQAKARAAQFSTLSVFYPCPSCADAFQYDLFVQVDGLTYMVVAIDTVPPMPARLQELIWTLEGILARPLP